MRELNKHRDIVRQMNCSGEDVK
ncbi:hypothetical protein [Escherichia coli]|nr:hypothetical protein [Escherichia coli]